MTRLTIDHLFIQLIKAEVENTAQTTVSSILPRHRRIMSEKYSPDPSSQDDTKSGDRGHIDIEAAAPSGAARWFGGPRVAVGRRIGPVLSSLQNNFSSDSDDSSSAILHKQKEAEANAAIQYRTCSWQKVCDIPRHACTQWSEC